MALDEDRIIRLLKDQANALAQDSNKTRGLMPVASSALVETTEAQLGFGLPPVLTRVLLEIGNGGRYLGPGFGLLGLPGGYDNDSGWSLTETSRETGKGLEWWNGILTLCDWGCCMMSCVDCNDSDFPVYRWNGNALDLEFDTDEPSDDLWEIESDTIQEWFLKPNTS